MRLLKLNRSGGFSLVELSNKAVIPPYAILSHTWSGLEDEVLFGDIRDGTGVSKQGFAKLAFCAKQAEMDGLSYFWIDTCCIDKSSITELQEAINTMYRWYRAAERCYVYLSDVSCPARASKEKDWERDFQLSRWFTRSWTLQELLAPNIVQFYSLEGQLLGDKDSLRTLIHECTGLPLKAIQGAPLSDFGVDERLSWARGRDATYEEDRAYSLLGILSVYMPIIYREGYDHALRRLHRAIQDNQNLFVKPPVRSSVRADHNPLGAADNLSQKLQPSWFMDRDDLPDLKVTEPERSSNVSAPERFENFSSKNKRTSSARQSALEDSRSDTEESPSSIEQVGLVQQVVVPVQPANIEDIGRVSYSSYRAQSLSSLQKALFILKRAVRPRLMAGKRRVEWTCSCGKQLYRDFDYTQIPEYWALQDAAHDRNNAPQQGKSAMAISSNTSSSTVRSGNTIGARNTTTLGSSVTPTLSIAQQLPLQTYSKRRFLELCVNTGEHTITLDELDVSAIKTDQALFASIVERYNKLRAPRLQRIFMTPVDVHFVFFTVKKSHRIAIRGAPAELPPPAELTSGRYGCTCKWPPPIDRREFLHYFHSYARGHNEALYIERFPLRLNSPLCSPLCADEHGWGIHIIEGPNRVRLTWCCVVVLIISFIVSVVFSVIMQTQEQGFGIGQWMVAVLTTMLAALYFQFEES